MDAVGASAVPHSMVEWGLDNELRLRTLGLVDFLHIPL